MFSMTLTRLFRKISIGIISLIFVGAVYADDMIVDYSDNSLPILNDALQKINKELGNTHSIPSGGTTGQALTKSSATNYAASWTTINSVPTGGVIPYAGSTAPTGYLICDGTAVSRTTYSALFAITSTTYGVGDGSTTFNLPNLKGRTVTGVGQGSTYANGVDAAGTNFALAAVGGMEKHKLVTAELAAHNHAIWLEGGNAGHASLDATTGSTFVGAAYTASYTSFIDSAGSDTAHNNLAPYMAMNWLIKT